MKFTVVYHELVVKTDIPSLPKAVKEQVKKAIEKKLVTEPEKFGKPLRKSLKGYRKLRVSDYRIVFRIDDMTVKVFVIQNRAVVYKTSGTRLMV